MEEKLNMKHLGLFEGIGGFSLAARWAGWETVAWCEWNEFGQKVLKYHFQESEGFGDITKTDFTKYANKIDIITGGFPCQPFSLAGKRKGTEDSRHLWPEMLRAIREVKPKYVVGENVFGLINWDGGLVFDQVQSDLEAEGYEVAPVVIPAAAVNAPHGRDRIWFVANSKSATRFTQATPINGREKYQPNNWERVRNTFKPNGGIWNATNTDNDGFERIDSEDEVNTDKGGEYALNDTIENVTNTFCVGRNEVEHDNGIIEKSQQKERRKKQLSRTDSTPSEWRNFPTQSPICSGNDGIPGRLDGITFPKWRNESIKAYGNAIVPQVAYEIFKVLNEIERINHDTKTNPRPSN